MKTKLTPELIKQTLNALREVGYNCLTRNEQKILDAWGAGESSVKLTWRVGY
jgi:hypothetical protein